MSNIYFTLYIHPVKKFSDQLVQRSADVFFINVHLADTFEKKTLSDQLFPGIMSMGLGNKMFICSNEVKV